MKRKQVPLSEQELKEQMKKEDADQEKTRDNSEPKVDDPVYKFPRTFANNEVLKIVEDLLQGTARAPVQGPLPTTRRCNDGVPVLSAGATGCGDTNPKRKQGSSQGIVLAHASG